jgi:hypothetical protein
MPDPKSNPTRHVASSNWIFMDDNRILENLCDHAIILRDEEGNEVTLLASQRPARCGIERKKIGLINIDNKVMVPVIESQFTDVPNLPAPDKRRMFIVPLPVAKKFPTRVDLYCVEYVKRGPDNQPLFAQALGRPL